MSRHGTSSGQEPRRNAERDAAQPIAGQPRTDDEDDELQSANDVPSFLTAKELQARDPAKVKDDEDQERGSEPGSDEMPKKARRRPK